MDRQGVEWRAHWQLNMWRSLESSWPSGRAGTSLRKRKAKGLFLVDCMSEFYCWHKNHMFYDGRIWSFLNFSGHSRCTFSNMANFQSRTNLKSDNSAMIIGKYVLLA